MARGRPTLPDAQRRTETLQVRATAAEVDRAYRAALRSGVPLSDLLREGLRRVIRRPSRLDRRG